MRNEQQTIRKGRGRLLCQKKKRTNREKAAEDDVGGVEEEWNYKKIKTRQ